MISTTQQQRRRIRRLSCCLDSFNTKIFSSFGSVHSKGMPKIILYMIGALFLLTTLPITATAQKCTGPETPDDLREKLFVGDKSNYQKHTRPGIAEWKLQDRWTRGAFHDVPPDKVSIQLHVLSVADLDQKRGEFQIMAWVRQRWNDHRLRYSTEEDGAYGCFSENDRQGFPLEDLKNIWKPDIAIQNEINSKVGAGSFWIYPDGDVIVAKSVQLTVSCKLDLRKFPYDVQKCNILVGTWLEDAGDIVLDFFDDRDPITIGDSNIDNDSNQDGNRHAEGWGGNSEWHILDVSATDRNLAHGATQKESLVQFNFVFERQTQYYINFVIFPSMLFVFIGWCSFYVSRGAAPARVTMTMICFLTNVNFLAAQLASLPRVTSGVWLLRFLVMSTVFTFYSVIEYVFCNYLFRVEQRVEKAHERARQLKKDKYGSLVELAMLDTESNPDLEEPSEGSFADEPIGMPFEDESKGYKVKRVSPVNSVIPPLKNFNVSLKNFSNHNSSHNKMDKTENSASTFAISKPKLIPTNKQDLINIGFKNKLDMLILNENGKMRFKDQHIDIFSRIFYPLSYLLLAMSLIIVVKKDDLSL